VKDRVGHGNFLPVTALYCRALFAGPGLLPP
jgi:hypothetical protein